MASDQQSGTTVEELIAQINALCPKNSSQTPEQIRLWVAALLTWRGKPVPQDVAMAIVLDLLLGKDFMPDGLTEVSGGRWYAYVRKPAA